MFSGMEKRTSSAHVAANVRRMRTERGWSLADLSRRLGELGYPMGVAVLSKLELGDRGIDVDDLAAIAWALGEAPHRLMMDPGLNGTVEMAHLVQDLYDTYDKRRAEIERYDAVLADLKDRIRALVGSDERLDATLDSVLDVYGTPTAAHVLRSEIRGDD